MFLVVDGSKAMAALARQNLAGYFRLPPRISKLHPAGLERVHRSHIVKLSPTRRTFEYRSEQLHAAHLTRATRFGAWVISPAASFP